MGKFKSKAARTGFNRPQATGSSEINREWKTVTIKQLAEGDIIAGKGIVKTIFQTCRDDEYYLEAGEVTDQVFSSEEQVYAFVKKEG